MAPRMAVNRTSVCIPAWNAEPFIKRTLACASAQTRDDIQILVSVDKGDDRTAETCRACAAEDSRITVFGQAERLGWAGNANFLLDQVRTEYFFFYFHDDLIEPTYVEQLSAMLDARPDATSAHGDMGHFGATTHVSRGGGYEGPLGERLFRYVASDKGPLLRSLTRRHAVESRQLRMPEAGLDSFMANTTYAMILLSLGPALHTSEILYRRWNQRQGGLTAGWRNLDLAPIIEALQHNAQELLGFIDTRLTSEIERELASSACQIQFTTRLRVAETERKAQRPTPATVISSRFAGFPLSPQIVSADTRTSNLALQALGHLLHQEGIFFDRRGESELAMARFAATALAHPERTDPWKQVEHLHARGAGNLLEPDARNPNMVRALSVRERYRRIRDLAVDLTPSGARESTPTA